MSPFIKYTEESQGTSGAKKDPSYVNVAYVVRATFDTAAEELELVVDAQGASLPQSRIKIRGKEAKAALKVLQDLP